MQRSDFFFELPEHLIAAQPAEQRSGSRLLCMEHDGTPADRYFRDFPDLLEAGDLLVFNDTKVIPARLYGSKSSGGKVEVLVERILGDKEILALLRVAKKPAAGTYLRLADAFEAEVLGRRGEFFHLRLHHEQNALDLLERYGHVPLPPYIKRPDGAVDKQRYQTVYARRPGAVAAPTAGLHFDEEVLQRLQSKGVASAFVTLHVGAGTFQPVRVENLSEHRMHAEWFEVSEDTARAVRETQGRGGRVTAVGTTSVRALESAARGGTIQACREETRLFITPGYRFQCVDALLTNFHLPESTLLMLVSAFAGRDRILRAYRHAVARQYRFFSYGDAMFVRRGGE